MTDQPPVLDLDFPAGWVTEPPVAAQVVYFNPAGEHLVVLILLADGVNLAAATYPGGKRFARVQSPPPPAVPALEEKYAGKPAPDDVVAEWRVLVDGMAHAIDDVAREMGLKS